MRLQPAVKVCVLSVLALSLFLFGAGASLAGVTVNFLPLGDSITADGYYITPLTNQLTSNGYTPHMIANEGHSGYLIEGGTFTSGETRPGLLDNIGTYLNHPNVNTANSYILMMIGANDVINGYKLDSSDTPSVQTRLGQLISAITTTAPLAHLIVAQITPNMTSIPADTAAKQFNTDVVAAVATAVSAGKNVSLVDMYTPFHPNLYAPYTSTPSPYYYSDGIHPQPSGGAVMAPVWYDSIRAIAGPGTPPNLSASTSLYAYYPLDANANDAAGTLHGTATAGVNFSSLGVIGNSASMSAKNNGIDVPTTFMAGGKSSGSISVWIKNTSSAANDAGGSTPLDLGSASTGNGMQISEHGGFGQNQNNFYFQGAYTNTTRSGTVAADHSPGFHLVTYTWNQAAGTAAIYQGGTAVANMVVGVSGTGTYGAWAGGKARIAELASWNDNIPVSYDDYAVWNNVLLGPQVRAINDLGLMRGEGAGVANDLFQFYETAAADATTLIDGQQWKKIGLESAYTGSGAWNPSTSLLALGASGGLQIVPEPGTLTLLGAAAIGLLVFARRNRKK